MDLDTFQVFVYGTLKRGGRFDCTEEALSVQKATLKKHTLWYGAYPFIQKGEDGDVVHGELHEYNIGMLENLDRIEGHPDLYERRTAVVQAEGQDYVAFTYYPVNTWVTDDAGIIEDGNFPI
jgi:gamma-glutamylcyclotransferase (GGCT)/AIG2-like uncharacterized protein YtfP